MRKQTINLKKEPHEEELVYGVDNKKYLKKVGLDSKGKIKRVKPKKQRVMTINRETATHCTGRKLGFCQLKNPDDCYGCQSERVFKASLPYHKRQEKQWDTLSATWYGDRIGEIQAKSTKKFTHLRFNEVGEMRDSKDIVKLIVLGMILKIQENPLKPFIYTTRTDLMSEYLEDITKYTDIVVNGSGFMAHNEYRVVEEGYQAKKNEYWCLDKCHNCRLCKERLGITILAPIRRKSAK